MFCVADALSPSLSVIVAVSVTRLSADSVVDWSGPVFGGAPPRGCWSSVTLPAPSTVTVNTSGVAGRRAALNRRAVQDQVHRLVGRRVDQARRARHRTPSA